MPSSLRVPLARAASFLVLPFLCVSCFEPPVRETMEIIFHAEGTYEVGVVTRISEPEENPAARERIRVLREEILRGEDLWTRALRTIDQAVERITYESHSGRLVEASRRVFADDPADLPKIFATIPVGAYVGIQGDRLTLELAPTGANRATGKQERIVRESLDAFAASAASYIRATADLYAYLDGSPERARPCFGVLFKDLFKQPPVDPNALSEDEKRLLEAVDRSMDDLTAVLSLKEGEAYTLDEMSRLVYDPFPAEVGIEITGTIEESAGFEKVGETHVAIQPVGLWSALSALGREWVRPSPVIAYVAWTQEHPGEPFDLDRFASEPRVFKDAPDAGQVRSALAGWLKPADIYRLRWRLPPAEAREGE